MIRYSRVLSWFLSPAIVLVVSISAPNRTRSAPSSPPRPGIESTFHAQEPPGLVFGVPVARTLTGGEAHTFNVPVVAGQYVRLRVIHRGIILVATLFDANGREVVEINNPSGGHGQILLSTIAECSANYKLRLRSTEDWANAGSYEVAILEMRVATTSDHERISAEVAFAEGSKHFDKEERGAYLNAKAAYEMALAKWDQLNDDHWRALTRYILGVTYRRLGERSAAREYFVSSLKIKVDENDWRLRAAALNDLGYTEVILGEKSSALDHINQALADFRTHNDARGQASALNNIAIMQQRAGELDSLLNTYEQILPLRRAEHDINGELNIVNNIGGLYDRQGEPYRALEYYTLARDGWQELFNGRKLREPRNLGVGFNNVAVANDELNRWPEAFENYDRALRVFQLIGDVANQAATLDNIGELHAVLGDPDRALEYYRTALGLMEKVKDPDAAANILTHMGQAHVSLGNLDEALSDFQSGLKIVPEPSPSKLANIHSNLGTVYAIQRKPNQALSSYETALIGWRAVGDRRGEAATLEKRGEVFLVLGDQARAAVDLNASLEIWRLLSDRRGEAATLNAIAKLALSLGRVPEALQRSTDAIHIAESMRTKIPNQRLRATYFATQQTYYELNTFLRMEQYGRDNSPQDLIAAFETSERSRARSLIDLLSEIGMNIKRGVSPDLLRRKEELVRQLSAKEQLLARTLNSKATKAQIEVVKDEIANLLSDEDDMDGLIRGSSPLYANLVRLEPLQLAEIQQHLEVNTLLLEYSVGEERSHVWAVTSHSIDGFKLPAGKEIEEVAKRLNTALTERNRTFKNETPQQWRRRISTADADYNTAAAALSKMVLEPLASLLEKERLVIVADGPLQLVSFAGLPVPTAELKSANSQQRTKSEAQTLAGAVRLIDRHEIVYEPSASVFALQRRQLQNRTPAPNAVAVLANPVFDKDDPRVGVAIARNNGGHPATSDSNETGMTPQTLTRTATASKTTLTRTLEDVGLDRFTALQFSDREARAIIRVAGSNRSMAALNFEASRRTATNPELSKYRNIHFATHAVADFAHPELSGIVLSLVDEKGQPQDGYLRLHDIYNLDLPAELVVLSACQTAVGKQIKGEGLIALTRGFMYAGARRVVASLWKVDDAATADLMAEFYDQMFMKKLPPAAALRAAQLKVSRQSARQSPYFWAGFVLQGEWH